MDRIHILLIMLFSMLQGSPEREADAHRVVTQIRISAVHDGETTVKTYSDSADMEHILMYLRQLDPQVKALIEPETFRADRYRITLFFSDGTSSTYRQIYGDYLQKNDGSWKRIHGDSGLLFPEK